MVDKVSLYVHGIYSSAVLLKAQTSKRINNIAKKEANFSNNNARKVDFSLFDHGDD